MMSPCPSRINKLHYYRYSRPDRLGYQNAWVQNVLISSKKVAGYIPGKKKGNTVPPMSSGAFLKI